MKNDFLDYCNSMEYTIDKEALDFKFNQLINKVKKNYQIIISLSLTVANIQRFLVESFKFILYFDKNVIYLLLYIWCGEHG